MNSFPLFFFFSPFPLSSLVGAHGVEWINYQIISVLLQSLRAWNDDEQNIFIMSHLMSSWEMGNILSGARERINPWEWRLGKLFCVLVWKFRGILRCWDCFGWCRWIFGRINYFYFISLFHFLKMNVSQKTVEKNSRAFKIQIFES